MFYCFSEDLALPLAFGSSSWPWAPQGPPQRPSPRSCAGRGLSCRFCGRVGTVAHPWMGERALRGHWSSQSSPSGSVACLEEIRDLSAGNPTEQAFFYPQLHFLFGLFGVQNGDVHRNAGEDKEQDHKTKQREGFLHHPRKAGVDCWATKTGACSAAPSHKLCFFGSTSKLRVSVIRRISGPYARDTCWAERPFR